MNRNPMIEYIKNISLPLSAYLSQNSSLTFQPSTWQPALYKQDQKVQLNQSINLITRASQISLMFFDKYKNKRSLGKGAFGQVYLVEDQEGKEYALKLISKAGIKKEPYLAEYLDGEIECMKTMDSPYIIKLYETLSDHDYIYLLLEFCDGGDLVGYQGNLKEKVYSLDQSTLFLADVIRGLEYLHDSGYLHRDLKLQNVLRSTIGGKEICKLADFGFSKPMKDTGGTNLGTEQFKAPQIFFQEQYGYGVDMWAFGVVLYFMLNKDYPFKVSAFHSQEQKGDGLKKAATNFSYSAMVDKTKMKKKQNCTPDMEDLFRRMFDPNPETRISFYQIREHPIFAKHFPNIEQKSKILYSNRFKPRLTPSKVIKNNTLGVIQEDNALVTPSRVHKKDKHFPEEKETLGRSKDQLDFLKDNAELFISCKYLQHHERHMIAYNLIKYYIVLLRQFSQAAKVENLPKLNPNLNWQAYSKDKHYQELIKQIDADLKKYEMMFEEWYEVCLGVLEEIKKINPSFAESFSQFISEKTFEGGFKKSYRGSTSHIYKVLLAETAKGYKGNNLPFLVTMNVISHTFNNIYNNQEHMKTIFSPYLSKEYIPVKKMNFSELREWLSKAAEDQLKAIVKEIIKFYP